MKLAKLIEQYETHPLSGFHKLRYSSRRNQRNLMAQIVKRYGTTKLKHINAVTILTWHAEWFDGSKYHAAHAFVKKLRTIFGFGLTILENKHCQRIRVTMHTLRFPAGKKRKHLLSVGQAAAIIAEAHKREWHSIAMAQAFQFELMLRQKDVIGEWVPEGENVPSDLRHDGKKWLRGLQGREINSDLVLSHLTSKRQKDIEANLLEAPLVMAEFRRLIGSMPPGPLIANEYTGLPYTDYEFRRKWRICAVAAGVPNAVFNMDSRAGAISEAFDAEADPDFIRETAVHSDLPTTQGYNRGNHRKKRSSVMRKRVESRKLDEAAYTP